MDDYIKLKKSNCKNCYKCIRQCPVKSIRFSDAQAGIVGEECILCGQCFVVCPQNAKEIRNDVPLVKTMLKCSGPVYASIAPSFVANFEGATIGSMREALIKLGFAGAEETAIGATIVKKEYERLIREGKQSVIISSCCPTVNLLIQKHYPDALPCLAPVISPMQAHCMDIRRRHPDAKTVFIGPCISKKDEAERYPGSVDCVLTFEELSGWLSEEEIVLEPNAEHIEDSRARLFPTSGGILKTMDCDSSDYVYLSVDGIENCIQMIKEIVENKVPRCFIEMSACAGSCIGGPAMNKGRHAPLKEYVAVRNYAGKKDFPVVQPPQEILNKQQKPLNTDSIIPGNDAILEVLRKLGKTKPEHELNCGTCGYNSCREKAIAVLQGKADLSMCLPYLKERAESFSDNVISNTPNAILVLNESYEVQQINAAACRLMNIKDEHDVLGEPVVRILDPLPFIDASQNEKSVHDKRVYLAEYDKYVDQTVIYDKSYHIILCFMRDVTEETKQRTGWETMSRTTLEITDKVIEKQMRAVQEIASLLGETTAETKVALTKLKESLKHE